MMILGELGGRLAAALGGHALEDGLLELAALDHVVGEPGLLVGTDEGHAADLLGHLLGHGLIVGALGQGHNARPEDLLEQGRVGGQEAACPWRSPG